MFKGLSQDVENYGDGNLAICYNFLCSSRTHNQIINATLGSCAVDSDRVAQKPAEVLRQGFHDPIRQGNSLS